MIHSIVDTLFHLVDSVTEAVADNVVYARPVRRFVQLDSVSCGVSAVLTVLESFECDYERDEVFEELGTDDDGTSTSAIKRVLRAYGLSARVETNSNMATLSRAIHEGKLCIVGMQRGDHWAVAYGISPSTVLVADSSVTRVVCSIPRRAFSREWDHLAIYVSDRRR